MLKPSFLALSLTLFASSVHAADTIYASYTGSQLGVTERDAALSQSNAFGTGVTASGIAAGVNHDLYLSAGNHLYNFTTTGTLVTDMTFPDTNISYTGVSVGGGKVVAAYKGSQQGVTVRDYGLTQTFSFNTGFDINGIAAGASNNVYLASGNHLYDYSLDGTLITNMTFPDAAINYSAVAYGNGMVFAAYTGSQRGVTLRDLALNQTSLFSVNFDISGIAAGNDHNVYLSSGNQLFNYNIDGTLIAQMTFPDNGINYSGVTVSAVPEPEAYGMLLAGLGLLACMARRRRA